MLGLHQGSGGLTAGEAVPARCWRRCTPRRPAEPSESQPARSMRSGVRVRPPQTGVVRVEALACTECMPQWSTECMHVWADGSRRDSAAHLGTPREVALVQAQSPELEIASTHAHSPHRHIAGDLSVGSLAPHLIPVSNERRERAWPALTYASGASEGEAPVTDQCMHDGWGRTSASCAISSAFHQSSGACEASPG